MLDKKIQQVLTRLAGAIRQGSKPYLLADHLALARMGPLSLKVIHDNGMTYVDNPATHWVLDSFKARAPQGAGVEDRAAKASKVLEELNKYNRDLDEGVKKTQEGIAERIDKVSWSAGVSWKEGLGLGEGRLAFVRTPCRLWRAVERVPTSLSHVC